MPDKSSISKTIVNFLYEYKEVFMLLFGIAAISAIFGWLIFFLKDTPQSIVLPMISILGIVALLLCLSGISYVFVKVKLDDKTQALGLPPGSIQSVIALSLVVLFAIISVFVLSTMGDAGIRRISQLSSTDRDKQIDQLGASFAGWQEDSPGKFTIFVRDPVPAGRDDVGKQLVVLIGTLMTSAVSFYFGSRATAKSADVGATIATGPQTNPQTDDATGANGSRQQDTGTGPTGPAGASDGTNPVPPTAPTGPTGPTGPAGASGGTNLVPPTAPIGN